MKKNNIEKSDIGLIRSLNTLSKIKNQCCQVLRLVPL